MTIVEGSMLRKDVALEADVVVVGSGSGGAVVARELALSGLDVIVLEEGPHVTAQEYGSWAPTEMMRKIGRAGGTTPALGIGETPTVGIQAGTCVGGSSVFTGGVCYRIPADVHDEWSRELGVDSLSYDAMLPHYERVEQMMNIHPVPQEMRSQGTRLFVEGAEKLGAEVAPIRRNTRGCTGQSKCNYGCPQQSKLSVDLNYLPSARRHGARIFADMRVEKVERSGGHASGVSGVILGGPRRRPIHTFAVRAKTVVLAAGSMHTPLIMMRSKVGKGTGLVGRNLSIHPGFAVAALFDEPVLMWRGALQSAFCYHPDDPKIIYNSIGAPANMVASFLPGIGPEFMRAVREDASRLAMFGSMIHDGSNGRVRKGFGREPIITYRMSAEDRASFIRGVEWGMRAYLEAGATLVYNPFVGLPPVRSLDELARVDFESIDVRRAQSMSYHPLGTCQMGTDPRRSVVDPSGQVHDLPGLYIADGSIFPSSVGVNSQVPILTMATRVAFEMLARRAAPTRTLRVV